MIPLKELLLVILVCRVEGFAPCLFKKATRATHVLSTEPTATCQWLGDNGNRSELHDLFVATKFASKEKAKIDDAGSHDSSRYEVLSS